MHLNSRLVFEAHAASFFEDGARVLEIAADGRPSTYQRVLGNRPFEWLTADLATHATSFNDVTHVDYPMDSEYVVPVPNDSFDVVVSGNVLEHVRKPWVWMPELARIVRHGGLVITISPVSWVHHEAPIDCWRAYPDGMRALCEDAGLDVEVAWWGSLEPKPSRRTYPGVGDVGDRVGLRWRLRMKAGWPIPVAYDQVTVARKPVRP